MTADLLAKAQSETRPCIVVGCDTELPVRVSCVPRGDDTYAVVVDVDQAALLAHLSNDHRRRHERGSASVAAVLAICIFGALLFLAAVTAGQRAMCATHHDQLRYCAHYQETAR